MINHSQQKSNEKKSASSSQGRRKKRPSLIPLRNSAARKSQINENIHLNDHTTLPDEETMQAFQSRQSGGTVYWSIKSENQLNLRTPSEHHSIYSSPRTPRSSPKELELDTPFVPFVHQSLTRTVWESEEIIPEEKEDIERKESQTHNNHPNNIDELEAQPPVCQNQVFGRKSSVNEDILSSNQYSSHITKSPSKIVEEPRENPEQHKGSSSKKKLQISFPLITTVSASQQNLVQNKEKVIPSLQNQNQSLAMQVTHEQYVSRAPIYYQQQIKASAQKSQRSRNFHHEIIGGKKNWQKFSFSYLESISIRPVFQKNGDESLLQDKTSAKNLNLTIANPIFEHIKSTKKQNAQNQTNFNERLLCISKGYEQKIGIEKEATVNASTVQSVDIQIQTEQQNNANHYEVSKQYQLAALTSSKDHSKHQKIEKESEEDQGQKENQKNQQNCRIKQQTKVLKSFACQYDQNDVGIKPSIKRVSIADSKNNEIFDIDSSNSALALEIDNKKKKNKKKIIEKQAERESSIKSKIKKITNSITIAC